MARVEIAARTKSIPSRTLFNRLRNRGVKVNESSAGAHRLEREDVICALTAWVIHVDPRPLRALEALAATDNDLGRLVTALVGSDDLDSDPHNPLGAADRLQASGEQGLAWLLRELVDEVARREQRGAPAGPSSNSSQPKKLRAELACWTEALSEMTVKAWEVLRQANDPPFLFRSGATPVRIEFEDDGSPFLRPLNDHRLRHALMEIGEWYRWHEGDGEGSWKRTALPAQLIANMLACPAIPLPVLTGIVEAPIFAPDGHLQTNPGYDARTKTFFDASSGVAIPFVSERPSREEVTEAKRLILEETLGDFPFVSDAERAHAVALLILPFVRELIPGPTPFHLIEKPSPGTGATLLAELPGLIFSGRPTVAMTEGRDEDEWRKRLFAKLRKGSSIIFIDNLGRRLDSPALSSALTAWPFWEDRILGVSETQRVPARAIWIGSGNNPAVSSEVSRRTVRIRLDAKIDRPWLREDFRHPNLQGWVLENRSKLVWACLTLSRAWIAAGCPPSERVLGMFEAWARVIGGILKTAEIRGFLENLTEFYESSDDDCQAWRRLMAAWWEEHKESEVGVKNLLTLAQETDGIDLGQGSDQSQRSRLGKLLSRMKDRVFTLELAAAPSPASLRLEATGKSKGAVTWRLVQVVQKVSVVSEGECFPPNGKSGSEQTPPAPESELAQKPVDDTHPQSAALNDFLASVENTHLHSSHSPHSEVETHNPTSTPSSQATSDELGKRNGTPGVACGHQQHWLSTAGEILCAVCHPPDSPSLVEEWLPLRPEATDV